MVKITFTLRRLLERKMEKRDGVWHGALVALFYGVISTAMAFINKAVLSTYKFYFPFFILALQMLLTCATLELLCWRRIISIPSYTLKAARNFFWPSLFCGLHGALSLYALHGSPCIVDDSTTTTTTAGGQHCCAHQGPTVLHGGGSNTTHHHHQDDLHCHTCHASHPSDRQSSEVNQQEKHPERESSSPLFNSLLEEQFTRLATPPIARIEPAAHTTTTIAVATLQPLHQHRKGYGPPGSNIPSTNSAALQRPPTAPKLHNSNREYPHHRRNSRDCSSIGREAPASARDRTTIGRDRSVERSMNSNNVSSMPSPCCRLMTSGDTASPRSSRYIYAEHLNCSVGDTCCDAVNHRTSCNNETIAGSAGSGYRHSYHEGLTPASQRKLAMRRPGEGGDPNKCELTSMNLDRGTQRRLGDCCCNHDNKKRNNDGDTSLLLLEAGRGAPDGRRCDSGSDVYDGLGKTSYDVLGRNGRGGTSTSGCGVEGCGCGGNEVGDGVDCGVDGGGSYHRHHHRDDSLLDLPDYIPLWNCHNTPVAASERLQQLESSKESLELQVTVLTEQLSAQADKIADLELQLHSRNMLLIDTDHKLQKEVLAVSELETQRLQLLNELSTLQLQQASSQHGVGIQMSPLLAGFTSPTPSTISTLSTIPPPAAATNALQLYSGAAEGKQYSTPRTPPPNLNRPVDPLLQSLRSTRSGSTSSSSKPSSTLPNNNDCNTLHGNNSNNSSSMAYGIGGGAGILSSAMVSGKRCSSAPNLAETEKLELQQEQQATALTQLDRCGSVQHPLSPDDRQEYGPADGHADNGGGGSYGPRPSSSTTSAGVSGHNHIKSPTSLKTLSSGNLHNIHSIQQYSEQPPQSSSPITSHKPTTIKKIFTRLRRSSSGHARTSNAAAAAGGGGGIGGGDGRGGGSRGGDDQPLKRGGVRATATARLGWSPSSGGHLSSWAEPQAPFLSWKSNECEQWLQFLGLSQYSAALRCWQSAAPSNHLSRATPQQLDKQLGVRHPLHRKKLQLAINARMGVEGSLGRTSPGEHIEGMAASSSWVSQWLDDVGLPQYKELFHEARVDPRVLNVLTWDDLAFLKVTSLLHATSLKRGIQVLREYNFDSSSLIRRSGLAAIDSTADNSDNNNTGVNCNGSVGSQGHEVCLWSNHRVMEWLKTVHLSEYAPNLRGSGVHGALLVYEVRFNSEVLAALLSIPSNKTLLRRHLNTHFKELVGREVVVEKRQVEEAPGYIALSTLTKIKPSKKSQFSLKRRSGKGRSGQMLEFDDLLCPLEERPPRATVQHSSIQNSPETRLC